MTALNLEPDFFILSIIDKEFKALMNVFPISERIPYEGRDYYQGKITGNDGKEYTIVATQSFEVGNTSSASATSAILQYFKPKFFLLIGIAGGVHGRNDLALGDVVVSSTNIKYYELEKETDGRVDEIITTLANPSRTLLNTCRWLSSTEWHNDLEQKPEGDNTPPKQISGLILSGERLLGDPVSDFLKELLEEVPKSLAVEMEGAGVSKAIYENSAHNKAEFLAIRGISDFCNKDGNQETRNIWRKYSSTSAAMFARKLIENTTIDSEPTEPKAKYILQFDKSLSQQSSKEFNLHLETNGTEIDTYTFFEEVTSNRKILLKGYAGGGKSEIMRRLATHLIATGITPVVISMNDFTSLIEEFRSGQDVDARMKTLMKASLTSPSIEHIESFNQSYRIIIDGLNEITGGTYGDEIPRLIVNTIEDFLVDHPDAGTVITDRLRERDFFSAWKELKLLSMHSDSVKLIIDEKFGESTFDNLSEKNQEILKTPYFLNYVLERESPKIISKAVALEDFFKNVLRFDDDYIDKLSETVFAACEKTQGLLILQEHMDSLGDNAHTLIDSGTINKSDQRYTFDHQLKHEYLLSRHLSKNPSKWGSTWFDIVTLASNSLESIYMTFEQLDDAEHADEFLLKVYDWNWNASIQCMIIDSKNPEKFFSEGLTGCMLALVGNKKLERVYGTSQSALQSLRKFESTRAQELAQANDLNRLLNITDDVESQHSWFEDWKSLFFRDRSLQFEEKAVNMIQSTVSLVGWTATGVLRDSKLNDENLLQLRTIYRSSDSKESLQGTRRWRVVHVLGKFPSTENIDLLFEALENDEYHWVRYGAARSLLESAAITDIPELRKNIIEKIIRLLPSLKQNVIEEIGKTVFHMDAGNTWKDDVSALLQKAKDIQGHESSKGKWEDIIKEFREGRWRD